MLKIKSYVKVNSLAEAYELNQKKSACIIGGMVWLKMGNRAISTVIDLSGLGLDSIQELEEEFVIGCMTPLHDLETNKALNAYTNGAMRESLRHIVGIQFRNCATVGGNLGGALQCRPHSSYRVCKQEERQRYPCQYNCEKSTDLYLLFKPEKYKDGFSGADSCSLCP